MAAHRDAGPGRGRQLIIRRYLAPRRRVSISMTMKPALHGLDHSSRIKMPKPGSWFRAFVHMWPPKKPRFGGTFFCEVDRQIGRPIRSLSVGVREGPGSGEDTRAKN